GRGGAVLDLALPQPSHGAALGAVHLEDHQLVAVDAGAPGGVDLGNDAALQLEGGVGGVVGGGGVGAALLIPALRDVGGAEAGDGPHRGDDIVEDVAPVAEHIHDDPAAVLLAIVPGGALG